MHVIIFFPLQVVLESYHIEEFGSIYRKFVHHKLKNAKKELHELRTDREFWLDLREAERKIIHNKIIDVKKFKKEETSLWCEWYLKIFDLIMSELSEKFPEKCKQCSTIMEDFINFIKCYDRLVYALAGIITFSLEHPKFFRKKKRIQTMKDFIIQLPSVERMPVKRPQWDDEVYESIVKFMETPVNDKECWFELF